MGGGGPIQKILNGKLSKFRNYETMDCIKKVANIFKKILIQI